MTWRARLLSLLLVLVMGAFGVNGLYAYATMDHLGIFDSTTVADQARNACERLSQGVEAANRPGTGVTDVVARIRAEDEGIRRLVSTMQELGDERLQGDHPAKLWVQDWQTLLSLRETYADELLAGRTPALVIPTVDDIPITHRMTDVSSCTVVEQLSHIA